MSNIQEILKALSVALHDGLIGEEGCEDLAKALNGVPIEHHMNAFRALLGIETTNEDAFEQPAEAPEDYLAVKTFTSSEFHVGDEIVSDKTEKRAVITAIENENHVVYYVTGDGKNEGLPNFLRIDPAYSFRRTGRNFPAIPAVLEELKKA